MYIIKYKSGISIKLRQNHENIGKTKSIIVLYKACTAVNDA